MKNKLYNIAPIFAPLCMLLYSIILYLNYDKKEDYGGWGGLAISMFLITSFVWLLIVCFINYLVNRFCKNDFRKTIIKIIITVLNFIIFIIKIVPLI